MKARRWAYRQLRENGRRQYPAWQMYAAWGVVAFLLIALITVVRGQNDFYTDRCALLLPSAGASLVELGGQVDEMVSDGDVEGALTELRLMRNILAVVDADCRGLHFTGSGNEVIGPVYLTAGLYRVSLEAEGLTVVRVESLIDGRDCIDFIMYADAGEPDAEAERTVHCQVLFEVESRGGGEWELSLALVSEN